MIQSYLGEMFDAISQSEFISGNIIEVSLTTSDNLVDHKLNRNFEGWTVIDIDANANVWQSNTMNNNKDKRIILKASAACNAKIYIF